jgi:hypothetical protein
MTVIFPENAPSPIADFDLKHIARCPLAQVPAFVETGEREGFEAKVKAPATEAVIRFRRKGFGESEASDAAKAFDRLVNAVP